MKVAECSPKGLKTLWEKEKLLIMSNFSFFQSVFKRLKLKTCKNQYLFGKGLTDCCCKSRFYINDTIFPTLMLSKVAVNLFSGCNELWKGNGDYSAFHPLHTVVKFIVILYSKIPHSWDTITHKWFQPNLNLPFKWPSLRAIACVENKSRI